jgi:hypothetical protein
LSSKPWARNKKMPKLTLTKLTQGNMDGRINPIYILLIIVLIPLSILFSASKLAPLKQTELTPIFDGKSLNGWEGDPAYWRVENGVIVGEISPSVPLRRSTFLIWRGGVPDNFELTFEYKISGAGNSGINYRSEEVKDLPYTLKGYQLDIDGANRYTGQNYEERGRTTLALRGQKTAIKAYTAGESGKSKVVNGIWSDLTVTGSLGELQSLSQKIKSNDWNTCRLVAMGNRLQHYINGVLMSDVTDHDKVRGKSKGLIGIQIHAGPPMKVEYRKILIKQ